MWIAIIILAAAWLLGASFLAGCFWIAAGMQIEKDNPEWLEELERKKP